MSTSEFKWAPKNLRRGDVIRVTTRMKNGENTWSCRVTGVDFVWEHPRTGKMALCVGYQPCEDADSVECAWGVMYFHPEPRKWGVQKAVRLGHVEERVVRLLNPFGAQKALAEGEWFSTEEEE